MSQLLATLMAPVYNPVQYILLLLPTWVHDLIMPAPTRMNGFPRTQSLREAMGIRDKEPDVRTEMNASAGRIRTLKDGDGRVGTHDMSVDKDIENTPFFRLDDEELVKMFGRAFDPELRQLMRAFPTAETGLAVTPGNLGPQGLSPSRLLYQQDYPEINRSIVGVLALKWVVNENYELFSQYQEKDRIDREAFAEMRKFVLSYLGDSEELYALVVATIANDLGKDKGMMAQITVERRGSTAAPNHDEIMYLAASQGTIPIVTEFPADSTIHKALILGLKFGSELNVPQFIQAENVPGSLRAVFCFKGQSRALQIKFLEILFDVAGAAGHRDSRCALVMTQYVWESYHAAGLILTDILEGRKSYREGYDEFLGIRSKILSDCGFRSLNVKNLEERALLRLLTIGRITDQAGAEVFDNAFNNLSEEERTSLTEGLSVDAVEDGTAIIPYYAPAIFSNTLRHFAPQKKDAKKVRERKDVKRAEAIGALFRFLMRVFAGTKPKPEEKRDLIVECNLEFAQTVVVSEEFKADPAVLNDLEIPADSYSYAKEDWI